jgi:hypothetical protein
MSRAFPHVLATELYRGPPKDFEIKFVLNNGRNKISFSCPCGFGISSVSTYQIISILVFIYLATSGSSYWGRFSQKSFRTVY